MKGGSLTIEIHRPGLEALIPERSEGMTVTFDMPKEIEAKFVAEAQARGVPLSDCVRDFVVDHYREDSDDLRLAQERLSDPQPGLTSSQLRKSLGLDD